MANLAKQRVISPRYLGYLSWFLPFFNIFTKFILTNRLYFYLTVEVLRRSCEDPRTEPVTVWDNMGIAAQQGSTHHTQQMLGFAKARSPALATGLCFGRLIPFAMPTAPTGRVFDRLMLRLPHHLGRRAVCSLRPPAYCTGMNLGVELRSVVETPVPWHLQVCCRFDC
jgi:hypothetical protein